MSNYLKTLLVITYSIKPKTANIQCLVPSCDRSWYLSGSSQGFLHAAASSHAFAHWERFHAEQKHPRAVWKDSDGHEHEGVQFCSLCKTISWEEYKKRSP